MWKTEKIIASLRAQLKEQKRMNNLMILRVKELNKR